MHTCILLDQRDFQ